MLTDPTRNRSHMLNYASICNIVLKVMGHFFWPEIFIGLKIFGTQNFLEQKYFWPTIFWTLDPKCFWTQKFVWTHNLFGLNFFWTTNFFGPQIFLDQNFFQTKHFLYSIFFDRHNFVLDTRFLRTQYFFLIHNFVQTLYFFWTWRLPIETKDKANWNWTLKTQIWWNSEAKLENQKHVSQS